MADDKGDGVSIDAEVFLDQITALQPPRLDKAVALALVDTAKNAIIKAASLIAKRTGLKRDTAKSKISYDKVRNGDRQVIIRSSRRPISLIEFPSTQQMSSGVMTKAWGPLKLIQGAFTATMPRTGHRDIYKRVGRKRLPIKKFWGPTIHGTFATPEVRKVIETTAKQQLKKNLLRRIKAEQRRRGR